MSWSKFTKSKIVIPRFYLFRSRQNRPGHCAWHLGDIYSSWRPRPGTSTSVGRSVRPFGFSQTGEPVRRPISLSYPRHEQSLEIDMQFYGQPLIVDLDGLNPEPMIELAQALYLSGGLHGPYPESINYVLATASLDGSITDRQNCVTHSMGLFIAGLRRSKVREEFKRRYPNLFKGSNVMESISDIWYPEDVGNLVWGCRDLGFGGRKGPHDDDPPPGGFGGGGGLVA